jgi:phage-related tail fiber protein
MATIKIKRGLSTAVQNLVLGEGELALAIDTAELYGGTTAGKVLLNPKGGQADQASKLTNPRNFQISGDGSSQAVSFNGEQDVNLVLTLKELSGLASGTYTKLTVNTKGQVVAGASIEVSDLPSIPVSKITGLGTAATKNTGSSVGNVVEVGSDGKIPSSVLPDIAITDTFVVESESAMLALSAQKGDLAVRTDIAKNFILKATPASTLANWVELETPEAYVHPTFTARTSGLYKITVNNQGHVTAVTAVTKDDIVALGIPAQDTTYTLPKATSTTLGGVKVGDGLAVNDGVLSVGTIDGGTF